MISMLLVRVIMQLFVEIDEGFNDGTVCLPPHGFSKNYGATVSGIAEFLSMAHIVQKLNR
jgi:hypothetical protein